MYQVRLSKYVNIHMGLGAYNRIGAAIRSSLPTCPPHPPMPNPVPPFPPRLVQGGLNLSLGGSRISIHSTDLTLSS